MSGALGHSTLYSLDSALGNVGSCFGPGGRMQAFKWLLGSVLLSLATAHAQCPVVSVMVKGRVENAPPNARVRVQLIFDHNRPGASADTTLENASSHVPI